MTPTTPSTPKVFISYRRAETAGHTGRLYDAMVARFGEDNVFMDVDMQPGVDFVARIQAVVAACHVLLVVIGPDWARALPGEPQARIADPEDFVRLEVATALSRSDVTVIPLLVERASMPAPEDLPENLRALTRRNALELSDLRWHADTAGLMEVIEQLLAQDDEPEAAVPSPAPPVAPTLPAGPQGPATPAGVASAWDRLRRHRWAALATTAAIVPLVVLLLPSSEGDRPSPVAPAPATTAPATNTGASGDAGGRPAGVPADCDNKGRTTFAREAEALREWSGCSVEPLGNVTGASLTYLEFADAVTASESLESARRFELDHGYDPCEQPNLERVYSGEAWCAKQRSDDTIEIYWHDADSRLMGLTTFASPTTVPEAVAAWSSIV